MTTLRVEDPRLLRGAGRFADDVDRPGQLWLRIVRSPSAHARLGGVETGEAAALPGVHAVVTARDLDPLPEIPVRVGPEDPAQAPFLQPVLARDRVRYVGEPVAAVLAADPYVAEDAAELVALDLDPLDPVLDAREACAPGAPALRDDAANEAARLERGYGDAEAAFARAAHVVEIEARVGRHSAVPMECRGLVAEPEPDGGLVVWGATKVPHWNRDVLAAAAGLDPERVVLRASDAGGGFGVRGELYPEDVLVCLLARRLGRAVKWVEDRAEHLVATNHSREQRRLVAGAFDDEGRLLALRDEVFHDNGAYLRTHGVLVPELTLSMLPGPYLVPAYRGIAHVALTNKTPCGTYRGPGRYEATFARERLLDVAAERMGIDPVALRRRNLLAPADLPVRRPLPVVGHDVEIDVGDFGGLLDHALRTAPYDPWQQEAAAAREAGRLVGVGLAFFLEKSGGGGFETARVTVSDAGRARVVAGGATLGQGIETVLARVVGRELGVEPAEVDVRVGDTGLVGTGGGSWASRSTIFAGGAALRAARATAERARAVAAEGLECAPEDVRLADGRAHVAGSPARGLGLGEVAAACDPVSAARRGHEPGLGATRTFAGADMTYPYGVHVAMVEIDAETGAVRPLRHHIAYEVGHAIDRRLVEGQLAGGAAQGIAGALLEEFRYDDDGQPQAASFMDYLLPTAAEVPPVTVCIREDAPSPGNPLATKGAGEGGTTGAGAAIAAAVDAALGSPGAIRELPVRPETVRALAARRPAPAR
jgi:carbon-monoxide dehydrogenase large subunit/6-hydroxypseudooxynicotine dehydrogenase subunit gamma